MGRRYEEIVVLAVMGKKNLTALMAPRVLNNETLEMFARAVARRDPNRHYYVTTDTQPKELLYKWFVGEGFEHHEGWWVDA